MSRARAAVPPAPAVAQDQNRQQQHISFQHTQLGVYLVGAFALLYIFNDSAQGIIHKYDINKKFFYLWGVLCAFAYLYLRPFIRRGLGSAQRGFINLGTLYILWLCSAVFYHLPSFEALGIDIKADVSLTLSTACYSLVVLGALHGLQLLLIRLRVLSPIPGASRKELWSCVLLNCMSLAVACSTYFSLCGNGGSALEAAVNQGPLRRAVCGKWLAPIQTMQYPTFSAWMLYGEGADASGTGTNSSASVGTKYLYLDFPLDGKGILSVPAGSVISPVFTIWVTLIMLYVVNVVADHAAAGTMAARHIWEVRPNLSEPDLQLLKELAVSSLPSARRLRQHHAGGGPPGRRAHSLELYPWSRWDLQRTMQSLLQQTSSLTKRAASLIVDAHTPSLLARRTLSSLHLEWALDRQHWGRASSESGLDSARSAPGGYESWPDIPHAPASPSSEIASPTAPVGKAPTAARGGAAGGSALTASSGAVAGGSEDEWSWWQDWGGRQGAYNGPRPSFLEMVPWYSGTSADLFKTMFDLMVSLKLFLGRFDMRTMQAATAASMADSINDRPAEGDGFTYEHYRDRQELWVDFIADTGDGGNPTYTVARALAAQQLTVPVGEGIPPPGSEPSTAPPQPPPATGRGAQDRATPAVTLPRGDVMLIGGDLAYPNPSRDTFEQRLFAPFQDALPPPPHYHPGRLVVHKPDLSPAYGVQDPQGLHGLSPRSSRRASAAALHRYQGPNAFAIPGNHDWIDGLETFIKQIQHKGWLGGWLLPQEKSYFALALPHGWWVFGLDLALVGDIDMCQYRYFANVVEQRMSPQDNVVIITHEPIWLLEWYWATSSSSNLRQLVRGHLRGRARVHLAGDLHFYMRHSYCKRGTPLPPAAVPPATAPRGVPTSTKQQQQQQQQRGVGAGGPPVDVLLKGSRGAAGAPGGGATSATAHVQSPTGVRSTAAGYGAAAAAGPDTQQQQQQHTGKGMQAAPVASDNSSSDFSSDDDGGDYHPPPQQQQQQSDAARVLHKVASSSSFYSSSAAAPHQQLSRSSSTSTLASRQASIAKEQLQPLGEEIQAQHRLPAQQPHQQPLSGPHKRTASPVEQMRTQLPGLAVSSIPQAQQQQAAAPLAHAQVPLGSASAAGTSLGSGGGWLGMGKATGRTSPFADAAAGQSAAAEGNSLQLCSSCLSREAGIASHLCDPEHLICNGSGGAFMHPTHVFSYARFASLKDEAAEATAAIYSNARECSCSQCPGYVAFTPLSSWGPEAGAWHQPTSPTGRSETSEAPGGGKEGGTTEAADGIEGEYRAAAVYPPAHMSLGLGRKNLHLFRFKNDRFDVIGGALYFLSVVSILPRCDVGPTVLRAPSVREGALAFFQVFGRCFYDIAMNSYLSLGMVLLFFLIVFGFAKGGGVGAVSAEQQAWRAGRRSSTGGSPGGSKFKLGLRCRSSVIGPLVKLRTGGLSTLLLVAVLHLAAHLLVAVSLLLLLELGVEICIKYESLGSQGMHSLYRWFTAYEDQHFPDPNRLRDKANTWSFGLYPGVVKYAMALFDLPEAIAVTRTAVCQGGGFHVLTRVQALGYYAAMLAYYWLLATPAMGFLFGVYLYICVNWFHVHYDEAFSALRIGNFKAITRMHITPDGDLEVYTLGCDQVPGEWQEDPRWYGPDGAGSGQLPAYNAKFPSRWVPEGHEGGSRGTRGRLQQQLQKVSQGWKLVDYLKVPRQRPPMGC